MVLVMLTFSLTLLKTMKSCPLRILFLFCVLSQNSFLTCVKAYAQAETSYTSASTSNIKLPVTASDYCLFLNEVAASDPHFLYDPKMGEDVIFGSIVRRGKSGNFCYEVIEGKENALIAFVSDSNKKKYNDWLQKSIYGEGVVLGEESIKSDASLRSNEKDDWFINLGIGTLALARDQKNEHSYQDTYNDVIAVAGILGFAAFGHELMLQPGEGPLPQKDPSPTSVGSGIDSEGRNRRREYSPASDSKPYPTILFPSFDSSFLFEEDELRSIEMAGVDRPAATFSKNLNPDEEYMRPTAENIARWELADEVDQLEAKAKNLFYAWKNSIKDQKAPEIQERAKQAVKLARQEYVEAQTRLHESQQRYSLFARIERDEAVTLDLLAYIDYQCQKKIWHNPLPRWNLRNEADKELSSGSSIDPLEANLQLEKQRLNSFSQSEKSWSDHIRETDVYKAFDDLQSINEEVEEFRAQEGRLAGQVAHDPEGAGIIELRSASYNTFHAQEAAAIHEKTWLSMKDLEEIKRDQERYRHTMMEKVRIPQDKKKVGELRLKTANTKLTLVTTLHNNGIAGIADAKKRADTADQLREYFKEADSAVNSVRDPFNSAKDCFLSEVKQKQLYRKMFLQWREQKIGKLFLSFQEGNQDMSITHYNELVIEEALSAVRIRIPNLLQLKRELLSNFERDVQRKREIFETAINSHEQLERMFDLVNRNDEKLKDLIDAAEKLTADQASTLAKKGVDNAGTMLLTAAGGVMGSFIAPGPGTVLGMALGYAADQVPRLAKCVREKAQETVNAYKKKGLEAAQEKALSALREAELNKNKAQRMLEVSEQCLRAEEKAFEVAYAEHERLSSIEETGLKALHEESQEAAIKHAQGEVAQWNSLIAMQRSSYNQITRGIFRKNSDSVALQSFWDQLSPEDKKAEVQAAVFEACARKELSLEELHNLWEEIGKASKVHDQLEEELNSLEKAKSLIDQPKKHCVRYRLNEVRERIRALQESLTDKKGDFLNSTEAETKTMAQFAKAFMLSEERASLGAWAAYVAERSSLIQDASWEKKIIEVMESDLSFYREVTKQAVKNRLYQSEKLLRDLEIQKNIFCKFFGSCEEAVEEINEIFERINSIYEILIEYDREALETISNR